MVEEQSGLVVGGRATYQHGIQNGERPIAKITAERKREREGELEIATSATRRATLSATTGFCGAPCNIVVDHKINYTPFPSFTDIPPLGSSRDIINSI